MLSRHRNSGCEQVCQETVQYGSKAVHHLDEQDQQLLPVLPKCNSTVKTFQGRALFGILEFAVLSHWRKAFDLRDYTFPQVIIRQGLSVSVSALSRTKHLLQENMTRVTMTAKTTKN
jgi:hypothetical protein